MQEPAFSVKLIGNACKSEEQRFNKQTIEKSILDTARKADYRNHTSNQDAFHYDYFRNYIMTKSPNARKIQLILSGIYHIQDSRFLSFKSDLPDSLRVRHAARGRPPGRRW